MKAFLKNYRQSPRKVRLVANAVKGKKIEQAEDVLSFMPKRAALPISKLIKSATANAEVQGLKKEELVIKGITVTKGAVMKRWLPRAHGRATPINKRMSHLTVELSQKTKKSK